MARLAASVGGSKKKKSSKNSVWWSAEGNTSSQQPQALSINSPFQHYLKKGLGLGLHFPDTHSSLTHLALTLARLQKVHSLVMQHPLTSKQISVTCSDFCVSIFALANTIYFLQRHEVTIT